MVANNTQVEWYDVPQDVPDQPMPQQSYGLKNPLDQSYFSMTKKAWISSSDGKIMLDETSAYKYNEILSGQFDLLSDIENMAEYRYSPKKDYSKPEDSTDYGVKKEKERIRAQKSSREYGRPDFFAIGTVYLTIPPTQISVSEERHNFRYKSLRSASDVITLSGRSTVRIDLDIMFTGLDDINSKLRPLVAQFKCTPFLTLDSEYLKNIISPETGGIMDDVSKAERALEELRKQKKSLDDILTSRSGERASIEKMLIEVDSIRSKGEISDEYAREIKSVLSGWYINNDVNVIMRNSDAKKRVTSKDTAGQLQFDAKGFIQDVVKRRVPLGSELTSLTESISNIDKLAKKIEAYRDQINKSFDLSIDERYYEKQIVGVLSQMSVATVTGYPDTLSCRISMHVFNYDPYTHDYGFVKGYDPDRYTPDICDCDIFIDWYAKRFLGESSGNSSLGTYNLDDSMLFRYTTGITYDDLIRGAAPQISIDQVDVSSDDGIVVTGISVTMRNIVQFLPILSGGVPTCQYMGAYNTSLQVNLNSTNIEKVRQIKSMLAIVARIGRTNNRLGRYNMFYISNPLVSLFGLKYFILESFSVDTVQGSPGLYSISMNASEFKLGLERAQQIDRVGLDSNERVLDAAGYILDRAKEYIIDSDPGHKKTIQNKVYYDALFRFKSILEASNAMIDTRIPYDRFSTNFLMITNQPSGNQTEVVPLSQSSFGNSVRKNVTRIDRGIYSSYYDSPNRASAVKRMKAQQVDRLTKIAERMVDNGDIGSVLESGNIKEYLGKAYDIMKQPDGSRLLMSNGSTVDWLTEREYLKYAIAEEQMTGIKAWLSEDRGLVDLKNFVFARKSSIDGAPVHVVDPTCYPDLELPLYNDLGNNKDKFKMTYRDLGLLHNNPSMVNKPAQTDWVSIEPDAFYSKISIHKLIDNTGNPGMEIGIRAWEDMADNCEINNASPWDPTKLETLIETSLMKNEDINNTKKKDDQSQRNTNAEEAANSGVLLVKGAIDGNTFNVVAIDDEGNERGDIFAIKIIDYNPATYDSGSPHNQPTMNITADQSNTKIARDVLLGNEIIVGETTGVSGMTKGQEWIEASSVTVLGWDKTIKQAMLDKKMVMNLDSMAQADEKINNINSYEDHIARASILGEMAIKSKRSLKKAILSAVSGQETGSGVKSSKDTVKFGFVEISKSSVKTAEFNQTSDNMTHQYISSAALKAFESANKTKTSTFERFDRYSQIHMRAIAERIKNQSRDDIFRMVRAFPTFKFYFVEEDRMDYKPWFIPGDMKNLDDLYSYNAIISIDITKNRKEASDTAVVKILNTKGVLDREKFGLYDQNKDFLKKSYTESLDMKDKDTFSEQEKIEEFILRVGTRIKIKMGYSSDASCLENVFTGQISEISMGDVITIVAQGYGHELTNKITGWGSKIGYQDHSAYKILDKIMMRPEITHFGFTEWSPIVSMAQKLKYRRFAVNTGPYDEKGYELQHPSGYRSIGLASFWLIHSQNPANSNIFTPEVSKWAEEWNGDGWPFQCENRTVWDIFQEFTRRLPGYITGVIPFDNRATIYFGPSDGYYSYSNEVRGLLAESNSLIRNPLTTFDDAVSNGEIERVSKEEVAAVMEKVDSILDQARRMDMNPSEASNPYRGEDPFTIKKAVDLPTSVAITNAEVSLASVGDTENRYLMESIRKIIFNRGRNFNRNVQSRYKAPEQYASAQQISIFKSKNTDDIKDIEVYKDKNGRYYDRETFLQQKRVDNFAVPANFKLIRGYHYFDSLRNIISNNITASDSNMWNRVEIVAKTKKDSDGSHKVSNPSIIVRAQVDDSIWKEALITKVINEQNAHTKTVAWTYALGNLRQGVNEMYSGNLTVMGDPSVKPNDVVFINDYYTDMHGAFEVREVNHHFSHDTGFITTIVPDCICYTNNSMAMANEAIAGGWYDDVARSMLWVYKVKIPYATAIGVALGPADDLAFAALGMYRGSRYAWAVGRPWFVRASAMGVGAIEGSANLLWKFGKSVATNPVTQVGTAAILAEVFLGKAVRNIMSSCQFAAAGWTVGRREPINFLPLLYAGRPYIAGVQGMRRSDWWEPLWEGWRRFTYFRVKAAPRYLSQVIDEAIGSKLSGGV